MLNISKINRWPVVLLLVLVLLTAAGCGSAKTVAEINGQKITRAQFDTYINALKLLLPQIEGMMADKSTRSLLEQNILETMIENILIKKVAAQRNVRVSAEELEEDYKTARAQIVAMYGSEEEFFQKLKELKLSEQDVKELLEVSTYVDKLYADFLAEADDDEIRAFLADNPEYGIMPAMIEPSHILLATEEEALAVRERILAGEDFGDLAEELSIEPAARTTRGYLAVNGEIAVNDPYWDRTFMSAAASLAVGELSEPVKTQFGWHLIILHSKTEEVELPFEQVREAAADALVAEKFDAFLDNLRRQADIKIRL